MLSSMSKYKLNNNHPFCFPISSSCRIRKLKLLQFSNISFHLASNSWFTALFTYICLHLPPARLILIAIGNRAVIIIIIVRVRQSAIARKKRALWFSEHQEANGQWVVGLWAVTQLVFAPAPCSRNSLDETLPKMEKFCIDDVIWPWKYWPKITKFKPGRVLMRAYPPLKLGVSRYSGNLHR